METPFITRWFLPALSGVLLALSFPGPPLEGLASLYHPQWAYVGLLPLFFALQNGECISLIIRGREFYPYWYRPMLLRSYLELLLCYAPILRYCLILSYRY